MTKGRTCHYCAYEQKDTEEDVSCQRAKAVNDFPLADGEYDAKHLYVCRTCRVRSEAAQTCTDAPTNTHTIKIHCVYLQTFTDKRNMN